MKLLSSRLTSEQSTGTQNGMGLPPQPVEGAPPLIPALAYHVPVHPPVMSSPEHSLFDLQPAGDASKSAPSDRDRRLSQAQASSTSRLDGSLGSGLATTASADYYSALSPRGNPVLSPPHPSRMRDTSSSSGLTAATFPHV